jgi:hypothetical protein
MFFGGITPAMKLKMTGRIIQLDPIKNGRITAGIWTHCLVPQSSLAGRSSFDGFVNSMQICGFLVLYFASRQHQTDNHHLKQKMFHPHSNLLARGGVKSHVD